MQPDVHAQVMELLQAATAERDLAERLRLLQRTQELLLRADTLPETVAGCLDYFLNLQADPHASLRRYAAHFLERVLFFKPSLALRCTSAVAALLADKDGLVRELALKAAIKLHGRALFLIALEHEASQFQRHREQLQRVEAAVRGLLVGGCPERPAQFQLAARWAKVAVLAQTPTPLSVRIRVPSELRGVTCLEDFPERLSHHLDLNALRQQAEELFKLLCNLVQHPPQGRWGRGHFQALLQCLGAVARQRPPLLPALLEEWAPLLRAATAAAESPSAQAPLPVAAADAAELRQCLWAEVQGLLASGITVEHRADLVELLHGAGMAGSLEDLATQAKCQQALAAAERAAAEEAAAEPKAKRPRKAAPRRAWVGIGPDAAEDESAFDTDALLSGETEAVCRHFEDYFGLPSQREPAGHVSGPALLASRVGNDAELARIALTSLNSLSMKRSLLRDRANERVVAFGDAAALREADGRLKGGAKAGAGAAADSPDLAVFLAADPANDDGAAGRDPRRSLLPAPRLLGAMQPKGKLQGGDARQLVALDAANVRLPSELAGRDSLQLKIFEEVLEAQRRMDKSAMRDALSEEQLGAFERLTRQVALHLLTALKTPLSPSLQRRMCQVYLLDAFDRAKATLEGSKAAAGEKEKGSAPATGSASAMSRLVELFYAKFTSDVSRWQEASQQAGKAAAEAAAKTPLRDILEGARGFAKPQVVFTYAELFQMFIEEFRRRELPRRELRAFLNEIPVVPLSAFAMLEAQCQQSTSRKMALLTVLSLVEGKPACRWQCLHLLFKLAYSGGQDSSVRFDTIRLIINKIYRSGPQPPMRWQLPHLTDAEAAPLMAGAEAEEAAAGWELPDDDFVPLQRLRGRCVEDIATLMLRSMAPNSAKFTFLVNAPLRVEQLRADLFKGVLCGPKDRVWLYLALCIKRPVLLHELVETFTKCDSVQSATHEKVQSPTHAPVNRSEGLLGKDSGMARASLNRSGSAPKMGYSMPEGSGSNRTSKTCARRLPEGCDLITQRFCGKGATSFGAFNRDLHWCMELRDDKSKRISCAVVGSSAHLLSVTEGANIDAHDAVIRVNAAPDGTGASKWLAPCVGARTTVRFTNQMGHTPKSDPPPRCIFMLEPAVECGGLCWMSPAECSKSCVIQEQAHCHAHGQGKAPPEWKRSLVVADNLHHAIAQDIVVNSKKRRPGSYRTAGFTAFTYAIGSCDHVTVYGFGKSCAGKTGGRYYENRVAVHLFHPYDAELEIMQDIAREGPRSTYLQRVPGWMRASSVTVYHPPCLNNQSNPTQPAYPDLCIRTP